MGSSGCWREKARSRCVRVSARRAPLMRVLGRAEQSRDVRIRRAQIALQGFQVADDDGEKIVEVVGHSTGDLADAFHLLGLTGALVGGPSFREITGYFRKPEQFSVGAPDRIDDDASPEGAFVLADPPSFGFVLAGPLRNFERPFRNAVVSVLRSIKRGEMPSDNFVARIALDPFGAGIPVDDVSGRIEHVDGVVGDAFHKQAETPLGIFEFGQAGRELRGAFGGALFKGLVQPLQFLFRLRSARRFRAGSSGRDGRCRSPLRPAPPRRSRSVRRVR